MNIKKYNILMTVWSKCTHTPAKVQDDQQQRFKCAINANYRINTVSLEDLEYFVGSTDKASTFDIL
jgi:hypothetical protein